MRKLKHFNKALLILGVIIISGCYNTRKIKTEEPLTAAEIKNLIDAKTFVFIPRYVIPMTGRRRDLTSEFEITIAKDSILSYLPFFGRGYIAPMSPSELDYTFTSKNFSYDVTEGRNGRNISIKPADQRYLQELYFRIYDNATASLNITSINRSIISYDGYIIKPRVKKTKSD